ncbi:hypothetical protein MTO96_013077 [Rhipicephalus appendiculatus]
MGLFTASAGIYILLYFYKYKATALSVFYGIGWGVAGTVGQLILSRLVDAYGIQGGLFLLAGITMHSIPIVMLAKHPSSVSIGCKGRETASAEIEESGPDAVGSADVTNHGKAEGPQEPRLICKPPLPESSSVSHALALFVTPAFYVIAAASIIDDYSNVQFSTTVVDYAIDKGVPLRVAKTLISFLSLGALIGRVAVPFLSDIWPGMRNPLYVLGFVFTSVIQIVMPQVYAYEGVAALALMHGIFKGTVLCLRTVLVAELLGVDRSAACIGVTGVAIIPLSLTSPAILGFGVFTLQRCMRLYHIILLSTVLTTLALIGSAFSPNITCMTITFGAMYGFGMGLFTSSATIYVLLYFYKYRATALSILYGIGGGVAGMVGQLILSSLQDTYGFQGGLFLLAGIIMHSIPIVMLARNAGRPRETRPIFKPPLPESSSLRHTLALFVTPSFYVIVVAIIIDDYSSVQFSTTIVDYTMDRGTTLDAAKTLISYSSLGALVGRVAVPFLSDIWPGMRNPLYVIGICLRTLFCLRSVLMAELLGVDRTAACAGVTGVGMIPLSLASPAILGSYRDGRGTYDGFYRMLAAINLAAAVMYLVFAVFNRRRRNGTWTNDDCEKKN